MPGRRQKISDAIEAEVLFRADHTCCICRIRGKDVQLHHIDGNSSNNRPRNLAVVCLDCHSRVTGSRGLGKSFRPAEVKRYKASWEHQVLDSRGVHRPAIPYRKELISQADLIVCEILACRRNNPRAEELLNLLYELHLWRGNRQIDDKIIEGLHHLALMSGLGSTHLAGSVAEKLWEMCHQFVGPEDVTMGRSDLAMVLRCIDALATLASFNCEFGHGRKATSTIAQQAENFFEVGLWYRKRQIVNATIRLYEKSLRACYDKDKLEFPHGRIQLRRSLRRLRHALMDSKDGWKATKRRINHLFSI